MKRFDPEPHPEIPRDARAPNLSTPAIFLRFLRFGLSAWGGPTAQISALREALVEREHWTDEDHFRRALAVYQALPGPEAHELCCWFGMNAGGRAGAIAAGLGFMLPGFTLMLLAAWAYRRFGLGDAVLSGAFWGAQAVVVGLVLAAALRLTRSITRAAGTSTKTGWFAWLVVAAAAASQGVGGPFWLALPTGGAALALAARRRAAAAVVVVMASLFVALWMRGPDGAAAVPAQPSQRSPVARVVPLPELAATGLTGGLVSFGGAYTAIPVVRTITTASDGWMTDREFLDGVAIGSVLPAPLVIFATFCGYLGNGFFGAMAMTAGMFLPAFAFTLLGHGLIEKLVEHRAAHAFLDGIACAVCGLVVTTGLQLLAGLTRPTALVSSDITRLAPIAIAMTTFIALPRLRNRAAVPILMGIGAVVGLSIGP